MSASAFPSTWLVRTSTLKLMGPFTYAQLCQLIQDRQVGLNDEVCPANSYWFYLNERHEVKRWLGVEIPRTRGERDDEDLTETDTGEAPPDKTRSLSMAATEATMGEPGEGTRWVKRPDALEPPAMSSKMTSGSSASVGKTKTIETARESGRNGREREDGGTAVAATRSSFFKSFGWLLILAATLIAYALLRLSRLQ